MASAATLNYFFADPEGYQAGRPGEFAVSERDYYEQLAKRAAGDIFVYPGHEPSSRPGLFTTPALSKGYAVALSSATTIEDLSDETGLLATSRWFGHASVVRIPESALPSGMREQDMRTILAQLAPEIDGSQRAVERSAQAKRLIYDAQLGALHDPVRWDATLDGHGHFAGVYKENVTLAAGAARSPVKYYLAVHTDSNKVGEFLNEHAVTVQHSRTLEEFMRSPQYLATRSYSERNARRLLARLCDALRLDPNRQLIKRSQDSYAAAPADHDAVPDLVDELFAESKYNFLHRSLGHTLLYYNSTVRLAPAEAPEGRIVQLRNARAGISVISLDRKHDYRTARYQEKETSEQNVYRAFPLGMGRHAVDRHGLGELTPEDGHAMLEAYCWSGKKATTEYADFSAAPRQLYSYRRQDMAGKNMQQFLLAGAQKLDLVPVAVILSGSSA